MFLEVNFMNNRSLFILSLMAFLSPFSASAMQLVLEPIAPRQRTIQEVISLVLVSAATNNLDALTRHAQEYTRRFGHIDTAHNQDWQTALHMAARHNNPIIIRYLITTLNANPYTFDAYGNNALHIAARYNCLAALKCLVEEFNVDPENETNYGECALRIAQMFRSNGALEYLSNIRNLPGNPMRFSVFQHPAANNAPVAQPNPVQPQRPLPAVRPVAPVAQPQPVPAVPAPVAQQPNPRHDEYAQLLIEAIDADNLEIVQEFIINGHVDLDAILDVNTGNTALHHALFNDHQAIAIWLVRYGAHVNIANNDGITALELIQQLPAGSMPLLDPAFVNLLQIEPVRRVIPANNAQPAPVVPAPVAPAPAQPKQQPAQPAANSVQRSDECPICREEAQRKQPAQVKKTTCCNNFICSPCFNQLVNYNNSHLINNNCPICRAHYPQYDIKNAVVRQ
jgi:ankyrin repeat protein